MEKIIALVSGLDSFCYLGQYVGKYDIEALIFNYGQRAQYGVEQMTSLIDSLKPEHPSLTRRTLHMPFLKTAYPKFQQTAEHSYPKPDYDPSVVLPYRNTIFITVAMAYAQKVGARRIIIGATIDDTGLTGMLGLDKFPDLHPKYLRSLEDFLARGRLPWMNNETPVEIWSPARSGMSKAKNLKMGCEIWGDNLVCQIWSCYLGDNAGLKKEKHCGRCYGCTERKQVFEKAKIEDKTEYEEG